MLRRRLMAVIRVRDGWSLRLGVVAAGLSLLATGAAWAQSSESGPTAAATQYAALREKYGVGKVQTDGVLEVRGVVQGRIDAQEVTTCLLRPDGDQQEPFQITGGAECRSVDVGTRVRVLGVPRPAAPQTLDVVAIVAESEIAEWDRMHAPAPSPSPSSQRKTGVIVLGGSPSPARPAATQPATQPPPRWRDPGSASRRRVVPARARTQRLTSRGWDGYVAAYARAVRWFNPRLLPAEADTIAQSIIRFCLEHRLDPRLVVAVIACESGFRIDATSRKGAMGLGQLMPGTAAGLGVRNAYDPVENVWGAVKLLRGHLKKYAGRPFTEQLALALASYNAGSGAVRRHGGVPPYRETQRYIQKVYALYMHLCGYGASR